MAESDPNLTADWSDATSTAKLQPGADTGRYELGAVIAQGGMGVVVRALDRNLNREIAVKLVHTHLGDQPRILRRFKEEAEILGRLQHPGIVPVHEVGILADGRPFFAMKLVAGRTLADLLQDRPTDDRQLGRFLPVFESICQTVAFAHSRGFIHRDLKPANVMVGEFGEVQVMDWGIAKEMRNAGFGIRNEEEYVGVAANGGDRYATTDWTEWSTGEAQTTAGQVVGTPAYMPPEQARGEIERVGPAADVFALGGILCTMLTGEPPFTSKWYDDLAASSDGNLTPVWERIRSSGAEAELIDIAVRCLQPEPSARPRDSGELVGLIVKYRAGVEERMRAADRNRAEAQAEAREQRKRRKVQLALAASVGLLLLGGAVFAWWEGKQSANEARLSGERDTEKRFKIEQAQQGVRANRSLADELRKKYRFKEADAALVQAMELANSGAPELLNEIEQARSDLAFVVRLDEIRYRKWVMVVEPGGKRRFDTQKAPHEYRQAFSDRGLDLTVLDPSKAVRHIAACAVKADLVAAIDDWALYETDETLCNRLLAVARLTDPGPWVDQLRNPYVRYFAAAVARLASEADPSATSSTVVSVLTQLMQRKGLNPSALLSAARIKHPTDFELAFAHGRWHTFNSNSGEEIGAYEAARALRPENSTVWNNLGLALHRQGNRDGAIASFKEAIRLDPKYGKAHYNLGNELHHKGDMEGAFAAWKEAIKYDPTFGPAYNQVGTVLNHRGDLNGAIAAYKEAIKHAPKDALAQLNLGLALYDKANFDGAIAAFSAAIAIDPTWAQPHFSLGITLKKMGDLNGAIAEYKQAIRLDPKFTGAYHNLGVALVAKRDWGGAIAACKEAIRLDPKFAQAYINLGLALASDGDLDGAVTAWLAAIRHDPKAPQPYTNLGQVCLLRKKYPEAIAYARSAIDADPIFSNAHALLGSVFQLTGNLAGAHAALTEAARLDPQRFGPLLAKLPAFEVLHPPREVKP